MRARPAGCRPARDPEAAQRTKFKALASAGAALGEEPVAAPVAVSFEETVNPAGIAQPACTGCGDCCGGCNVGAKNTVALTYLPDAVRHGAQIFTHAKVRHVAKRPTAAGRCTSSARTARRQARAGAASVGADIVVLAAGTLGSTEILLRSRAQGLAVSDRLGHRFSANGDIIAFGYGGKGPVNAIGVGHPSKVEGLDVGAAVSGQIEIVDEDDLARSLTHPGRRAAFGAGAHPAGAVPPQRPPAGRAAKPRLAASTKARSPACRLSLRCRTTALPAVSAWRTTASPCTGPAPGTSLFTSGSMLRWKRLVKRAGGRYVKNPLAGTMMGHQPATAHPLGGCGMGREREDGVVNHKGQVFDGNPGAGSPMCTRASTSSTARSFRVPWASTRCSPSPLWPSAR